MSRSSYGFFRVLSLFLLIPLGLRGNLGRVFEGSPGLISDIARLQGGLEFLRNPALVAFGEPFENACEGLVIPEIELVNTSAGMIFKPRSNLGLSIGWNLLADGEFSEQNFFLGLGWEFLPGLSLGIQARLYYFPFESSSLTSLSLDLGLTYTPWENLSLGLTIEALNQPSLIGVESLPVGFRLGILYDLSSAFALGVGFLIDEWGLASSFGAKLRPLEGVGLRFNLEPESRAVSLGFLLEFNDLRLEISSRLNLESGLLTHGLSLGFYPLRDKALVLSRRININQGSLASLLTLPEITRRLAERIIKERELRPFTSLNELLRVEGLTARQLKAIKNRASVMDSGTNVLLLTNQNGAVSWINGMEIRNLVDHGLEANLARRIILFRASLGGFTREEDLRLLPETPTNWIGKVFKELP